MMCGDVLHTPVFELERPRALTVYVRKCSVPFWRVRVSDGCGPICTTRRQHFSHWMNWRHSVWLKHRQNALEDPIGQFDLTAVPWQSTLPNNFPKTRKPWPFSFVLASGSIIVLASEEPRPPMIFKAIHSSRQGNTKEILDSGIRAASKLRCPSHLKWFHNWCPLVNRDTSSSPLTTTSMQVLGIRVLQFMTVSIFIYPCSTLTYLQFNQYCNGEC